MSVVEKYFRAIGWNEQNFHPVNLPDITQSFPDFKRWVLLKMEEEGFVLNVDDYAIWETKSCPSGMLPIGEEIKNNEILSAAIVAATRYFEEKK